MSTHTETQNGAGVFPMNPTDFDNRLFRDSSDKTISGLMFQIGLTCAKGQVLSVKFVEPLNIFGFVCGRACKLKLASSFVSSWCY